MLTLLQVTVTELPAEAVVGLTLRVVPATEVAVRDGVAVLVAVGDEVVVLVTVDVAVAVGVVVDPEATTVIKGVVAARVKPSFLSNRIS